MSTPELTYATLLSAVSQQFSSSRRGRPALRAGGTTRSCSTGHVDQQRARRRPEGARPGRFAEARPAPALWRSVVVGGRDQEVRGLGAGDRVECSDSPNPRNPAAFRRLAALAFARAGDIGPPGSWNDEACASWPARAADRYSGPWIRRTANPVLVIGDTYDPSTAYRGAVAMVRDLARARLLTVNGFGHTELLNPSACSRNYESRYFIRGTSRLGGGVPAGPPAVHPGPLTLRDGLSHVATSPAATTSSAS
jgi:TAP-like protein